MIMIFDSYMALRNRLILEKTVAELEFEILAGWLNDLQTFENLQSEFYTTLDCHQDLSVCAAVLDVSFHARAS